MQRKPQRAAYLLFVIGSLFSACTLPNNNVAKQSTLDAISASVRQTSSAVAAQNQNPNAPVETAQAEATAQAQSVAATLGAVGALSAEDQAATATAVAPILAELPKYGVDPTDGKVAWIHPPVSLEVQGFMQFDYINHFISTLAQDFVISADIKWDAIGSESSCGFVLRSDGNQEAMNTYLATISRVASGHFLFLTVAKGEVVTGQDIYADGRDPAFDWQNEATNRLTVVGRGNHFWIYTNGTLIGDVDPSAPPVLLLPPEPQQPADTSDAEAMADFLLRKASFDDEVIQVKAEFNARKKALQNADTTFERGFMAMVALSRAGTKATCQFDNAWLWLIE
ncbi:MAG: hypothetical protein L0287_27300 [Anaerolineae bacterium]|nr:hypothetical protein [Anaerolineae bacterium]